MSFLLENMYLYEMFKIFIMGHPVLIDDLLSNAAGYVELPEIFRTGFICGVLNCLLWGIVGVGWWKFIGLY